MTTLDGHSPHFDESRAALDAQRLVRDWSGEAGPFSQLSVVATSASTNSAVAESLRADGQGWPHMSALVAGHQTSGRGRAGRTWETPEGSALTVSIVLRPESPNEATLGWLPLVVGVAAVRALATVGADATLKWPNDIVVPAADAIAGWGPWRKVGGILCEVVGGAVVAGVGLNVSQLRGELPVEHATSLALEGAATDRGELLGALGTEVRAAVDAWSDGSVDMLAREVASVCSTLGQDVTVTVAGAAPVSGRAVGLSGAGGLLVDVGAGGRIEVLAGDVSVRASA